MRDFSVEDKLKEKMKRLFKKDRATYNILTNKVQEILNCENVDHYKNLKNPLQHLKRVHINGPFVLTFKYIPKENKILFYDFDHHDNIYRKL